MSLSSKVIQEQVWAGLVLSKTELTKFVFKGPCVSCLQSFLLLGTLKLWSMKKSCYIEDVFLPQPKSSIVYAFTCLGLS